MTAKPKRGSRLEQVAKLVERGLRVEQIADRLGLMDRTVRAQCARLKRLDHYRAMDRARAHRTRGSRPLEEELAARRAQMQRQWRRVKPLLKRGMSFSAAGERLGITRNAIAGLTFRMRQREEASA